MAIRYLKIALVAFVALMALLFAAQNVVNLGVAYQVTGSVVGMENHAYYPDSLGPAITSPFLIWLTVAVIILSEFTAGIVAAKGTWDLWAARRAPAGDFNAAKTFALLGCGIGVLIWFGLFAVIAGAYFQMWQTELGGQSLNGAFQYFMGCGLVFLIVNASDN